MQELHSTQMEMARAVWRVCAVIVLCAFLIPLVGTVDGFRRELEFTKTGLDVVESSIFPLIKLVFYGAFAGIIAGFIWGKGRSFLRLSEGLLEEHYFFWEKEFFNRVDLRTVTNARKGVHLKYVSKGGVLRLPAFLFTRKGEKEPLDQETDEPETVPHILIPRGVPEAEIDRFFDQVTQEIKRLSTGRS